MLPFGGQGSNQAIEDAGVLGELLKGLETLSELPQRLQRFEIMRLKRTSMVQILSSVRGGRESEIQNELQKYAGAGMKGKEDL